MAGLNTDAIKRHIAEKASTVKQLEDSLIFLRRKKDSELPRKVKDAENLVRAVEQDLSDAEKRLRSAKDVRQSLEDDKWKLDDEIKSAEAELRRANDAANELKRDLQTALHSISKR